MGCKVLGGGGSQPMQRPAVGDEVVAVDGSVGQISGILETERAVPRYMVVATRRFRRRYPVISCGLVTHTAGGVVRVRGERRALARLGESLPLVV